MVINEKIVICIPTVGEEILNKTLESIAEHTKNKNVYIVIADDSEEKEVRHMIYETWKEIAKNRGKDFAIVVTETDGNWTGIGNARKVATEHALEVSDTEYIFHMDDDVIVKDKSTFNNIIKAMQDEQRIGYCGTIGNYTAWDHDFDEYSASFYTNLGVFYCIRRKILKEVGLFDEEMIIREDTDMGIRVWNAGYWVVAVWAPVKHTRSETITNDSETFTKCSKLIGEKHDNVMCAKDNSIRRRGLEYPNLEIGFDEGMNFYSKSKGEENE